MKPPKKRTPKASKKVEQPQRVDVTRADLQPIRASGRSLSDFEPLLVAERTLLQACLIGKIAVISKQRPEQATEENNVFAPSDPLVFQNPAYAACVPGSAAAKAEQSKPAAAKPIQGAGNWYLCATLPQEYTGFSPLAYSLDVILPLVDLQQQKDWSPMIPTPKPSPWNEWRGSGWKHITRLVLWAETLFGWLASLLLVAIVSGLTKRRED